MAEESALAPAVPAAAPPQAFRAPLPAHRPAGHSAPAPPRRTLPAMARAPAPAPVPAGPAPASGSNPPEFDHAITYVTRIKQRFKQQPHIYKQFLEALHAYQNGARNINDVLDTVCANRRQARAAG